MSDAPAARLRFTANTPALADQALQAMTHVDLLVMPHEFTEGLPNRPAGTGGQGALMA